MLHLTNENGIAVIRLDHGKVQALDLDLCDALIASLSQAEREPDIKAAVLTGTGTAFSAGVDLIRYLEGGDGYVDAFLPRFVETFLTLFSLPLPVVAAVNGHAIAGGCVLAAACDYRIMARDCGTIGVPELAVSLPFPLAAIEILRFGTSEARLQEMIYSGRTYGPDDARQEGLVDELSQRGDLLTRALDVAAQMAREPVARFRITKQQLRGPTLERIGQHAAATDPQVLAEWKNPRTVEAIRSYVSRMRPSLG